MLILLWLCVESILGAHPFESQFVGHKVHVLLSEHRLDATIELEVPMPLVERAFQESGQVNKTEWLSEWMHAQQLEMVNNLWLDINEERKPQWDVIEHSPPMWQESSNFLVFESRLSCTIVPPLTSVLLLDQIWLGEQSVFWTEVDIERSVNVLATDQIEWTSNNRYTTRLKRWSMEERQREIRLSLDPNELTHKIDAWWSTAVLNKESMRSLKSAVLPKDFWREWKLGETPWWLAILSGICALLCGVQGSKRSSLLVVLFGSGLSVIPVLPWKLRIGTMLVLGCITIVYRLRWYSIGLLLCILCYPSWIIAVGCMLGFLSISVKKWSVSKKIHLKT
jgi:hypothetical protein